MPRGASGEDEASDLELEEEEEEEEGDEDEVQESDLVEGSDLMSVDGSQGGGEEEPGQLPEQEGGAAGGEPEAGAAGAQECSTCGITAAFNDQWRRGNGAPPDGARWLAGACSRGQPAAAGRDTQRATRRCRSGVRRRVALLAPPCPAGLLECTACAGYRNKNEGKPCPEKVYRRRQAYMNFASGGQHGGQTKPHAKPSAKPPTGQRPAARDTYDRHDMSVPRLSRTSQDSSPERRCPCLPARSAAGACRVRCQTADPGTEASRGARPIRTGPAGPAAGRPRARSFPAS